MHSAKDRSVTSSEVEQRKVSFARIKRSLDQIVTIALPLHIQCLNEKSDRIQLLKNTKALPELHAEQVEAAKYLRLLKVDLYDLEQLNLLVEDKDKDLFYTKIQNPIKDAVETLSKFMELHPDALEPFPDIPENKIVEVQTLVCHLDKENQVETSDYHSLPVVPLQIESQLTSKAAFPDWSFLQKELVEVHSLIRHFASMVFLQKESVDSIQNNVEQAHGNVQEGVSHLKKASILKAATFPVAGAIVGGLLLGPFGALAGFKLVGIAAFSAGGGALGYKAGVTLKRKHEIACDVEMKALTFSSKEKSTSNPELFTNAIKKLN